jgi:hypothetical protein
MGMTRSLIKTSGLIVALILVGCSLLSAWAFISYVKPKAGTILDQIVSKYDAFLPEITLRNGQASIRGTQPYFVDTRGEKDLALVVDTREEKQKDALDYLKDVSNGVVLTRDSLITKQEGQVRIIPLKGMPDFEMNSRTLQELAARYAPQAAGIAWGAVIAYYLTIKLLQVLIFALVPYLALQSYKVPFRYGEALKVATFCMVPPVLYDTFLYFLDVRVPWSFVIYFAAYVGLLALAAKDLIKNFRAEADPTVLVGPS